MKTAASFGRRRFLAGLLGSASALTTLPASAATHRRSILIQRSPLAGFQFHHGQALWSDLREGDALTLTREPDNPHDARAVRVDWRGSNLGYVPRHENTAVAQMLDRGERVEARISALGEGPNPWHRIELEVRLAA